MSISEIIKQAREELGMTQEDLAERLEVSRQAVSKWELGASVPSPENLKLLEELLGVEFPAPEEAEEAVPEAPPKPPFWNWKRVVLLVLGVLIVSALLSIVLFETLRADTHTDVPRHAEPYVTGLYFFNEDAGQLQHDPEAGAGWYMFDPGARVYLLVTFQDGAEDTVNAVSLFLTPTGTETLEYREQLAVQAAGEGRDFALFAWDIPEELTAHLEIVLECGGGDRVTETLNVATPYPEDNVTPGIPGILSLSSSEIYAEEGDMGHYTLEAYGAPFAEVEWTSSDPSVARVANTGTVFAEGPGEAVITASWKGQTAECIVRVCPKTSVVGTEGNTDLDNPNPIYMPDDGISYEPGTLSIPIGATLFMSEPDPLPLVASGAPVEEIVWTSSNPAVVEVSDTGVLLPVSPGVAVVTAEWNGQTAECRVEVFTKTIPTDTPGVSKAVR